MADQPDLPVHAVLPEVKAALAGGGTAVLVAPPGAGKTTALAPLLLDAPWSGGQIVVTSPRRVAARAAAERMAQILGERVGHTVGYQTRFDSRHSAATRILVMSEALLVKRLVAEPDLPDVCAILFDEVHERSLAIDVALALALESRSVLRPDLRLLAMSATMDEAGYAGLLGTGTPVIESEGRSHPLEVRWLGTRPHVPMAAALADAAVAACREQEGDLLVFVPSIGDIRRTADLLASRLPDAVVHQLHGQAAPEAQRAALRRDRDGRRRVVLATNIAETSLTLDGVRVVVDSGLTRRARYDPVTGTTRLTTERASQASATQRAGRAARQQPGVVYRLWEEAAHAGRPPFDEPEIRRADLSGTVLTLAAWGTTDPAALSWLDPPPAAGWRRAQERLRTVGALDDEGKLTPQGRRLASLPLEPADGAMLLLGATHGAARTAARLVLLLQERGLGGRSVDLDQRLAALATARDAASAGPRRLADGWAALVASSPPGPDRRTPPLAVILAAGRPDLVAKRRDARGERWLTASGRAFVLDAADPLARSEMLVIADAQGDAAGARITAAAALSQAEAEHWFADRLEQCSSVAFDNGRIEAVRETRLGALVLSRTPDPQPDAAAVRAALMRAALDRLDTLLPQTLLARLRHADVTALDRERLRARAGEWLEPLLAGRRDIDLPPDRVVEAVTGLLSWDERQRLDLYAPAVFVTPAGTRHPIDYAGADAPSVTVRVQALFGLDEHPTAGRAPLLLKLASPAGRPVQATRDLPGFWRGSWRDVQKEMKGRYPRHRWPDEPWREAADLRTKNAFAARPR
ncbi:ATP-dependent helicase HrpB [Erythrobacteraceae bacterium CFH 75059]|uniref:ATP-dependent helicase HrpB n=1 Tax=Qipengyuania thermophila TaxID=2509361 RepID=UPI001020F69C|nr:ATP-dependent helicase HrpB [Qipengyuania thermophila]TCD05002.1 ATP-dependent helicase HrpB [Erythrobacteraceae bacterium CFH 75059]